jgi:alanine racemase
VSAHPTEAVIDLAGLRRNLRKIQERLTRPCEVLAVVKANAYGHGAPAVARCLAEQGVGHFGVAFLEEGLALRRAGITQPILVLAGFTPEQVEPLLEHGLTPVVAHHAQLEWLAPAAARREPVPIHLKVDTGMGRLGILPAEVPAALARIQRTPGLVLAGMMSHFSEEELGDSRAADEQLALFEKALEQARGLLGGTGGSRAARAAGDPAPSDFLAHIANSAAIFNYPRAWLNMVRPGIILYGYLPPGIRWAGPQFEPILTLRTRLTSVKRVPAGTPISYGRTFTTKRESVIGVLPIGYADGFSRALSNHGAVLVRGRRAPIVGRVCMDMTMIDLTEVDGAAAGDTAVMIGRQGQDAITADEIARLTGTICYEVLCGIGPRIPRIYTGAAEDSALA